MAQQSHDAPDAPVGDPLDDLVRAVTSLSYAMGRSRVHDRLTAAVGVKIERPEIALLRVLCDAPGPLRVTDVAERLLVRTPHVTRQAAGLEQDGLIRRAPDPSDQRAQLLELSDLGRTVVLRLNEGVRRIFREVLAEVRDDEIRSAARIIEALVADSAARLASEPDDVPGGSGIGILAGNGEQPSA
ncbi:MarR family transcriptional regulator [Streptomyces sp. NBC_01387]|uniref:MarR family winged helix-turn-helix transcriptional regulator n=1 Tax=unclassified Streptomyces TaxID=2593676 RepID=UPI0020259950|nr:MULTISPECIES: MarR family transcriptional regulator [unclassified Streptomyces]MCX4552209.1 MarR family transcriptional regulator [Streptomyces sp. NBC_01500]WSC23588.1 MarR family transcriptional regulator [Streptomyces sp. NBC_01766]WSV57460.1 MarR family transcriptional regulator [Streptomyces sp. NBC_01014]